MGDIINNLSHAIQAHNYPGTASKKPKNTTLVNTDQSMVVDELIISRVRGAADLINETHYKMLRDLSHLLDNEDVFEGLYKPFIFNFIQFLQLIPAVKQKDYKLTMVNVAVGVL